MYLVPGLEGKGFGTSLLKSGTAWVRSHLPNVQKIHARINGENKASIHVFKNAGFANEVISLSQVID